MTEPQLSIRRPLELMQRLQGLADQRAAEEAAIASKFEQDVAAADKNFDTTLQRLNDQYAQRRRELENAYAASKQSAAATFEDDCRACREELEQATVQIEARRRATIEKSKKKCQESQFESLAVFDGKKDQPALAKQAAEKRIHMASARADGLLRDAAELISDCGIGNGAEPSKLRLERAALPSSAASTTVGPQDAEHQLQRRLNTVQDEVLALQNQWLAQLLLGNGRSIAWIAAAASLGSMVGGMVVGLTAAGLVGGALVGLAVGSATVALLRPRAKRNCLEAYAQIRQQLADATRLVGESLDHAAVQHKAQSAAIAAERDSDLAAAQRLLDEATVKVNSWRDEELARIEAVAGARIEQLSTQQRRAFDDADHQYPPQLEENAELHVRSEQEINAQHEMQRARAVADRDQRFSALADAWRGGFQEIIDELAAMNKRRGRLFPDWSNTQWSDWSRPEHPPEAIAFGSCWLPMHVVKNGISKDTRLAPPVSELRLPAVMSWAENPRMVVTADGAGRRAALDVLQLTMLRLLTCMPAGKLRFTIIDAAGLGEGFSALMHLNDYDEQITGGRIWTEGAQINQRLSLISDHMEKVLQKYLRNQFESIHEYNQQAGEVAEPYHVVVVANFPAGLNDASARKLATISASGPRCGVYTLISVDRGLRLPHDFQLSELLQEAVHLDWAGDHFVWRYPLYEKLPLLLDPLPPAQRLTELLCAVAQESREASKVEVPFAMVAPQPEQWWTSDSGSELAAPIGRAGAREMLSMRLGKGTSQHVLISGKTGSGKSTLLHALITNLALHYGPDQVEFYLVDFKKGVEFKAYANGQLPHARVIAVESEREFGVSVLQRLDQELQRRGELFRANGVQDLAGFRAAAPGEVMPRTLLIVDEFQELFVTDDRLAQEAALLLDRLVRQGRAFGIHVLLGSQTLAGAYSLARSTIGQMAVRIALECSEADAHLILSDDNTAARLLSRPGEAIYNDQNGLVAGNHPFQIVWLPDQERQQYLTSLRERPTERRLPTAAPTIVFEGNVPADPLDNEALTAALREGDRTVAEPTLWLGAAVRIEPPTHLVLRRQGGHNLMIVGQHEPLAAGMLAGAAIALAGQQSGLDARIAVLDGARPESTEQGLWARVADAVGPCLEVVPPRGAPAAIAALAEEVARRNQAPEQSHSPRYLVVHDLAQFRDLRQSDDEFSFSFAADNDRPPAVDKQFRAILKEGPVVGVHVLLWCESYNSMSRAIDRLTLREIEFRVAVQMGAADSTSVIDSPAASQLGEHRAILYRDDLGTQVKFRPYGSPDERWLQTARRHLSAPAEPSVAAARNPPASTS